MDAGMQQWLQSLNVSEEETLTFANTLKEPSSSRNQTSHGKIIFKMYEVVFIFAELQLCLLNDDFLYKALMLWNMVILSSLESDNYITWLLGGKKKNQFHAKASIWKMHQKMS